MRDSKEQKLIRHITDIWTLHQILMQKRQLTLFLHFFHLTFSLIESKSQNPPILALALFFGFFHILIPKFRLSSSLFNLKFFHIWRHQNLIIFHNLFDLKLFFN